MLCSCGQKGTIVAARRELPYCKICFEQHLAKQVRKEVSKGSLLLKPSTGTNELATRKWEECARALAELARREVIEDEKGLIPGCAEIAAAQAIRYLFGQTPEHIKVFPKNITHEELQSFFSELPALEDNVAVELQKMEQLYPGTLASIIKSTEERGEQPK